VYKIVSGHLGYYKKRSRECAAGGRTAPGLSSTEIVRHAWLLNVNTQLSLLVEAWKPRKAYGSRGRRASDVAQVSRDDDVRATIRPSGLNKDSPRPNDRIDTQRVALLLLLLGVNVGPGTPKK